MLLASANTRFGVGWSRPHFIHLCGYSKSVFVSRTMSWIAAQFPRPILGWYLGTGNLGLFVLASRLFEVIVHIVIVPRSSVARIRLREFSDDPTALARAFNVLVRETAIVSFPISCGLASIIPALFSAFLGNQWQSGIFAAQIMALIVIPLTFYYCSTAVLFAARALRLDFRSSVVVTAANAVTVLVAAPFGLNIVCGALVLQTVAFLPVPLTMVRRATGSSPVMVIWTQLPLLGAAAVMGLAVTAVRTCIDPRISHMVAIPVLIVVGVAIYLPLAALAAPNDTKHLLHRVASMLRLAISCLTW